MQRTPGSTPQEREAQWTRIINEARANPRGIAAYCEANNLSKSSYYFWLHKLRSHHPEWQVNLSDQPKRARKISKGRQAKKEPEDTQVVPKAKRRQFTAKEKARILNEADEASRGEVAALLRREGIYSSHLQKWRRERDLAALQPKKRGPQTNPLTAENRKLKAQNEKLAKRLRQAEKIIELQKKMAEILGETLETTDGEA
jgi:transposase-like protein